MDEISDFDYSLPDDLIAHKPTVDRDASRLLVINRATHEIRHHSILDLPQFLNPDDCLIINNSRVIPARLLGKRKSTGGRWEGLFLGHTESGLWKLIGRTRGKLQPTEEVTINVAHDPAAPDKLSLTLIECNDEGIWLARPDSTEDVFDLLDRFGTVPLPPYLRRELATAEDWQRYQTVYAESPGSVAAPTAGLHFTEELLAKCRARGVKIGSVTLHVGIGTFRPIAVQRLCDHQMHAEWCHLPQETADLIATCKDRGGRVIAVGTTTVRTLEAAAASGPLRAQMAETDIFIRPPFQFRVVDGLLTNFHLPRSTLLVLVSTFAGIDVIRSAYAMAIEERYRFYSYGDAMLII